MNKLLHGDNLALLRRCDDNYFDSIVTDPPYGLSFMGKKWDYDVPSVELWRECLRVLKPGGHLLAFGGTRTYHRLACAIEDAGFEIRDQIQWLYGSGFPKSHNISKLIDKQAGAEREILGYESRHINRPQTENWEKSAQGMNHGRFKIEGMETGGQLTAVTKPATELAKQWDGWGTALKPANEPICLARKPLSEKTVAANVTKWRTGGINIDASRVSNAGYTQGGKNNSIAFGNDLEKQNRCDGSQGRWPANVLFGHHEECELSPYVFPDGSTQSQCHEDCPVRMIDEQSGQSKSTKLNCIQKPTEKKSKGRERERERVDEGYTDSGGASRFFYVAKVSKRERGEGNVHPTIKPIKLMEYLITLITPPHGIVLDPFMGSGSTGIAANNLGFHFIGIEIDADYFSIAKVRIG